MEEGERDDVEGRRNETRWEAEECDEVEDRNKMRWKEKEEKMRQSGKRGMRRDGRRENETRWLMGNETEE